MPNPDKVFPGNYDQNFNPLLIFMLVLVVIANVWLTILEVYAGIVFFTLIAGVTISMVILFQLTKGDPEYADFAKYIKAPFGTSLYLAAFFFIAGFVVRIISYLIEIVILKSSFIQSFTIPLFAGKIDTGITQSFAIAQAESSMPLILFNRQFNAGTIEEYIFSFGAVFIVGLILYAISRQTAENSIWRKKYFILTTSILVAVALFIGAHVLNATYATPKFFILAGVFRLVSLISIYIWGIFLMFWIGFHHSNNLIDVIREKGAVAVANGFISWYGLFFVAFFLILIWYLISRWKDKGKKELKEYFKS